jgi:hypothetical protein
LEHQIVTSSPSSAKSSRWMGMTARAAAHQQIRAASPLLGEHLAIRHWGIVVMAPSP